MADIEWSNSVRDLIHGKPFPGFGNSNPSNARGKRKRERESSYEDPYEGETIEEGQAPTVGFDWVEHERPVESIQHEEPPPSYGFGIWLYNRGQDPAASLLVAELYDMRDSITECRRAVVKCQDTFDRIQNALSAGYTTVRNGVPVPDSGTASRLLSGRRAFRRRR